MTKTQLRKLVALHAKTHNLNKPSISHYARANGLHPSTLCRWLSGDRKNIGPTTKTLLDILYLQATF